MQATANALGIRLIVGPIEATACGNIITQMIATNDLPDLDAGRELIANSTEPVSFFPESTTDWEKAYQKYLRITAPEAR